MKSKPTRERYVRGVPRATPPGLVLVYNRVRPEGFGPDLSCEV